MQRSWWQRIESSLIAESILRDDDRHRRARFALLTVALGVAIAVVRLGAFYVKGPLVQALAGTVVLGFVLTVPLLLRRGASLVLVGHLLAGAFFTAMSIAAYVRGGIGKPPWIGLGLTPMLALFVAGGQAWMPWCALVAIEMVAYGVGHGRFVDQFPQRHLDLLETLGGLAFLAFVTGLGVAWQATKRGVVAERDAFARQKKEAEDAAAFAEADRMAAVGRLAAGVAHEANNPLAYVTGNLAWLQEQLQEARDLERRDELLEVLSESLDGAFRVARIVRDLMSFARGHEAEEVEEVAVVEAAERAAKLVGRSLADRAELVLRRESDATVAVPEGRLVQVLVNLLLNAADAIGAARGGQGTGHVELTVRDDGATVVLEVRDDGAGISPENLRRVTEPFFTTKPVGQGTGLGLAVSQNLVRSHGGSLDIASELGRGTTVTITLPRVGRATRAALRAETGQADAEVPGSGRPRRVLLVDDDRMVRTALARLLHGHDLVMVEGGNKAIELIAGDQRFDVILCDLMMPDGTGVDVHDAVAARHPELCERLYFITGGALTQAARDLIERHPERCLAKPIEPAVLRRLVAEVPPRSSSS